MKPEIVAIPPTKTLIKGDEVKGKSRIERTDATFNHPTYGFIKVTRAGSRYDEAFAARAGDRSEDATEPTVQSGLPSSQSEQARHATKR